MRRTPALRSLIRETDVRPGDLIAPLFVKEELTEPAPIGSMPGQSQHTLESLRKEAVEIAERGVRAFILFAVPARKDPEGSEAWNPEGIGQQAIAALRTEFGDDAVVIGDLCLDEYTDHGHCGVLNDLRRGRQRRHRRAVPADRDRAGGGGRPPRRAERDDGRSGRRDPRCARRGRSSGHRHPRLRREVRVGAYGPFREAAEGAPRFGDRTGYQEDPANLEEALREIRTDIDEGADIVMVKPALPYLDVIRRAKDETRFPMAAYHVSGEYAMVKAAAANGWLDERRVVLELLTSIRRAGADLILTYHAKDAADWLRG